MGKIVYYRLRTALRRLTISTYYFNILVITCTDIVFEYCGTLGSL